LVDLFGMYDDARTYKLETEYHVLNFFVALQT